MAAMEITVLVIEDQLALREYLRKILEKEAYRVLTASSGKEALALLKKQDPDIILLDLLLPERRHWLFSKNRIRILSCWI
ncbi:MAG: hypothetical protein B6241_14290 [Spirochaetaceae bacterium 4572_59]|nr:MAG: hypothetical protein B6241_14290 [Spirochaetaceae bacterium 4572_59]